jgi:hypothetical protein
MGITLETLIKSMGPLLLRKRIGVMVDGRTFRLHRTDIILIDANT